MEVWKDADAVQKQLDDALRGLSNVGKDLANAERIYRTELSKRILELRVEGVPVTIIGDIARGEDKIAELKEKRDIAESLFDSKKEAINVKKLELKRLMIQYEKEFDNEK